MRPAALRPAFVRGRWRKPRITARKAASIRNRAITEGLYKSGADLDKGEWDPEWDRRRAPHVMREPKGSIAERKRPARIAEITKALAGMDDRIEEMRESRKKPTYANMWEKLAHDAGLLVDGEFNKAKFKPHGEKKK